MAKKLTAKQKRMRKEAELHQIFVETLKFSTPFSTLVETPSIKQISAKTGGCTQQPPYYI